MINFQALSAAASIILGGMTFASDAEAGSVLDKLFGPIAVLYVCVDLPVGEPCLPTTPFAHRIGPDFEKPDPDNPGRMTADQLRMGMCDHPQQMMLIQTYVIQHLFGPGPRYTFKCVPYNGDQEASLHLTPNGVWS